jgi:hypothetical protein
VAWAIASKLLHIKRPAFFPVLDRVLRSVYEVAASAQYTTTTGKPSGHLYWAAFRDDLIDPENLEAFDAIRGRLRQTVGLQANSLLKLHDLRLLDMLAWMAGTSG